ncbi:MAG: protein kinase [Planctomycetota bacterium]
MTKMKNLLADRVKLKLLLPGNRRRKAESPAESEADVVSEASNEVSEDPEASDARIDWIEETVAGPTQEPKSMTFTFPPGSQPLSPYTIRRGVGVGGFGEVYFAVSEAGKEVALKRVQRNLDIELRGVSQCLNLKHPNLVSLHDICRDSDGGAWVVMEYVAGQNLRQILDQHPDGLPEEEAKRWFLGIASGVSHLHSAGLVHRDLKPGNVFDDLGIVKVGDYGLSKYISTSQRGGQTESVGTFHYMAPEIGKGNYGREIDVYALGVILFELLTGRVPFDGESLHEIIVKHLTALPDLKSISEPYRSVIAQAMEKDPSKRQSTVEQMVEPLTSASNASSNAGRVAGFFASKKSKPKPAPVHPSAAAPRVDEPVYFAEAAEPVHRQAAPVQSRADTASIPVATPVADNRSDTDEPVMRAVRSAWTDFRVWWRSLEHSPKIRFFMALLIGFAVLINTHWLLPVLSMFAVIYVPYYVIRQMVLYSGDQPSYAKAQTLAAARPVVVKPKPMTKQQWKYKVRESLRSKPRLTRAAELNTSWIATSLTVVVMTVVAGAIGLKDQNIDAIHVSPYFWSAFVVLLGSAGILGLGKFWEVDEGEGMIRRIVLACVGAGVGLVGYSLLEYFMIPGTPMYSEFLDDDLPQALYRPDGTIRAAGMMAHFALLFGGMRWWKSVDPLRRTRLSFWSVAVVCVAAWMLHQFLPVPQPLGLMVAGGLSIATQMSAPWINPKSYKLRSNSSNPADQRVTA